MDRWKPPIPPKVERLMPTDPFERWLAEQALAGHDRQWLRRNAQPLRERWERDPETPLPAPLPAPERPYNRYNEV